jgi:hypothetical protein
MWDARRMLEQESWDLVCFFDEFDDYAASRGLSGLAYQLRKIREIASAEFAQKKEAGLCSICDSKRRYIT